MIKITAELFPHGSEKNKKLLGTIKIYNDLTGTHHMGNYKYIAYKGDFEILYSSGEIFNFSRMTLDVWHLLFQVLKDILYDSKI